MPYVPSRRVQILECARIIPAPLEGGGMSIAILHGGTEQVVTLDRKAFSLLLNLMIEIYMGKDDA